LDSAKLGMQITLIASEHPLWDRKAYIAYKMVTPAPPQSLLGLQDRSEKLIHYSLSCASSLPSPPLSTEAISSR